MSGIGGKTVFGGPGETPSRPDDNQLDTKTDIKLSSSRRQGYVQICLSVFGGVLAFLSSPTEAQQPERHIDCEDERDHSSELVEFELFNETKTDR